MFWFEMVLFMRLVLSDTFSSLPLLFSIHNKKVILPSKKRRCNASVWYHVVIKLPTVCLSGPPLTNRPGEVALAPVEALPSLPCHAKSRFNTKSAVCFVFVTMPLHHPKRHLQNATETQKCRSPRGKVLVLSGRARRGHGGQEAREDVARLLLLDGLCLDGRSHAHGHLVLG